MIEKVVEAASRPRELTAQQVIDSAVVITDVDGVEHIRRSFAGALREMIPVSEIAFVKPVRQKSGGMVYRVSYIDSMTAESSSAFRKKLFSEQGWLSADTLLRMQLNGRYLRVVGGETVLMQPVVHRERLDEIVIVRSKTLDREAMTLIAGFSRLYRNFMSLKRQSERDPLTGLLNRRTLDTNLGSIIRDSADQHRSQAAHLNSERRDEKSLEKLFLAVIDIDHFKSINDGFGHLFGDEVIVRAAQALRESFREEDLVFRYGGEEFVVVFSSHDDDEAFAILDRLRERFANLRFPQLDRVTVSIGFTAVENLAVPAALVSQADQALYFAKEHGRNQVCNHAELLRNGQLPEQQTAAEVELF